MVDTYVDIEVEVSGLVHLILVGEYFGLIYSALFLKMTQLLLHVSRGQVSGVALLAGHGDRSFVDIFG